jgi:VanZ like family
MGAATHCEIRGCCLKQSAVFWARCVFALLFVVVTWLTLTPNPDEAKSGFEMARWIAALLFGDPDRGDKIAHFTAYGTLGASAFFARLSLFGRKRWTPLYLAAYGAMLEGMQGFGGVRSPEAADAIANALGAVAGFGGAFVLIRLLQSRKA